MTVDKAAFTTFRPCNSERLARTELRRLLPARCKLHAAYTVDPLTMQMYKGEDKQQFIEHIHEDNGRRIGQLLYDEKRESFYEDDFGYTMRADFVIFTRQEWAKYESDLITLLTQTRLVDAV